MDRKWWVLAAVGAGGFMSALDGSIVNVMLPVIAAHFGIGVARIEWLVTIYLLVVSALLLGFGRIGDLRGHRAVYLRGFAVFVAGSALCGAAPTEGLLVASRAVQGLGAAMLFAAGPAILTASFPARQRGRALGLLGTMVYLGLSAGPPLGGWLAGAVSWRAAFYVNVPIGLAALLLGARAIPRVAPAAAGERFDRAGAAAFAAGLVALLLALNRGHVWGWASTPTLALLAAAGALLGLFVAIERRTPSPMLDLRLFGSPAFASATASATLNYVALFHMVFVLPFVLIQGRGLAPAAAGALLMVQSVTMAVVAPVSGALSDRVGTVPPSTAGMAILAGGLLWLSRLGAAAPLWQVGLGIGLAGLGTGVFIAPNNSALMGAAPRGRQGMAAAILAEARNVGMMLGVALSGAVVATLLERGRGAGGPAPLLDAAGASLLAGAGVAALGALTSVVRGGGGRRGSA